MAATKKAAKKTSSMRTTRAKKAVNKAATTARKGVGKTAAATKKAVNRGARKTTNALHTAEQKAGHAIDRAEEGMELFERKANAAKVHAKYKMLDAKDAIEKGVQRSEDWVKNHPVQAVAGAAAVGWLLGKIFRRKK